MQNFRFFESKFFMDWGWIWKYEVLYVLGDLSTSSLILTSCTEINLSFLDFAKEIYVEMERKYLNQIFHYVSSRWLRKNGFPTIAFLSRLVRP